MRPTTKPRSAAVREGDWRLVRQLDRVARRMGSPILEGNRIAVSSGARAFEAVLEAIRTARRSLAIEMYTWADDRLGRRFAEAVAARAAEGLSVFVLVDSFGSYASGGIVASLERSAARVVWYHPLAPWTPSWYPNRRNHRKLVLVDGETAFIGGMNLAEYYSEEFVGDGAWCDLMLRIDGPAVRELARIFLGTWIRSGGDLGAAGPLFIEPEPAGEASVQVVGGRGLKGRRSLRRSFVTWIALAERRIFLANAYFAPEMWLRRELCRAARRGVRVELLLPGKTDAPLVSWAGRASYQALLSAGAQIREMERTVLHAKVAVVDDRILLAGSANLDYRSFRHNLELAVNVFDESAARAASTALEQEYACARAVTPESWSGRSWPQRFLERLAYSLRYWL